MKPLLILLLVACSAVQAADRKYFYAIDQAMKTQNFQERLDPRVRLYFGEQAYPEPTMTMGERVANRKTNAFGKSDREACEWVLLSALLALQERALADGGNAVVNIRSYYKKNIHSSQSDYECHTGAIIAGVALIGDIVRLP